MLLKDFIKEGTARLESLYPESEARNIVLMLCEERIGTRRYTHLVEPEYSINDKDLDRLFSDMHRLASGEPVQYVLGYTEFCGLRFKVTPEVLIPRPETELLCQEAVRTGTGMQRKRQADGDSNPVRVLDLCTGSGCIAWSVALGIPGAEVIGTDISEKAIMVARNQDFSSVLKETGAIPPRFIIADVLGDEKRYDLGKFDLILGNPPYIMDSEKDSMRRNVLDFEPHTALFVPDDDPLLFYRAIARWSFSLLSQYGTGMTEINEQFGDETREVFLAAGFSRSETVKDYFGKNRFIIYQK